MTDGNVDRINLNVPTDLKERLKQSDESQTKQVVEALEIYFGESQTGNRAAIERQIQRYQQQKARGQQMIQNGRDMVEEAEEGISRLNDRLEQLQHDNETYQESLTEVLDEMRDGKTHSVWEDHATVQRISRQHDKTPNTVIDDLKARSEFDESRFEQQLGKPDDDELDLDDEVDLDYEWGDAE